VKRQKASTRLVNQREVQRRSVRSEGYQHRRATGIIDRNVTCTGACNAAHVYDMRANRALPQIPVAITFTETREGERREAYVKPPSGLLTRLVDSAKL